MLMWEAMISFAQSLLMIAFIQSSDGLQFHKAHHNLDTIC